MLEEWGVQSEIKLGKRMKDEKRKLLQHNFVEFRGREKSLSMHMFSESSNSSKKKSFRVAPVHAQHL